MRPGVLILVFAIFIPTSPAQQWPHWRGPSYNSTTPERLRPAADAKILIPDPAWQRDVGEGCSSVVVSREAVFATGWNDGKETVWCLNNTDGSVRWSKSYRCPRYGRYAKGDKEMYSGPTATPTLDGDSGYLYTLSPDGDLRCWNTAKHGALVWKMNLYDTYNVGMRPNVGGGQRDYGYTTAPLVSGGDLLAAVGGQAGLVVAVDKHTGRQRWASENRDFASNCGGMSPISVDGIPCVAVLSLERLVVIRIDKGHEGKTLARYPWTTFYANNLVTPTVVGNSVILSSGYNLKKTVLVEIGKDSAVKKWESKYFSGVCSPAVVGDKIYFAYQQLRCLNLTDGSLVWSGGRFGADGSCLVTGDGYVIVYGNKKLTIADSSAGPDDTYREAASRNDVCEKDAAWPHVVFAGARIYCKDRQGKITCFDMSTN